jgi:hypothetical protein
VKFLPMTQTSHDHLFKEVLGEFFPEFIDLFFPRVSAYLDPNSLEFLPLETFADLTDGSAFETDLIVKARFREQESFFITHIEHQGEFRTVFDRRMFNYFALLHRDYGLPVYPIVIFSHRSPRQVGDRSYVVEFPDWEVLRFNYRVIRLNHLSWREFVDRPNPVASAFMAKMKIKRQERPDVKLACLRSLARLNLNPAQQRMLSGFIDTYLRLEPPENQILTAQLDRIEARDEKEKIMQIVTSWMEEGIEQGIERGREEQVGTLLYQLRRKLGSVSAEQEALIAQLSFEQLRELGGDLLDFTCDADLNRWLQEVNA